MESAHFCSYVMEDKLVRVSQINGGMTLCNFEEGVIVEDRVIFSSNSTFLIHLSKGVGFDLK